jgi:flagellin
MGIENTDMTTQESSSDAINEVKGAILYVSQARSRLGAYQNRLEHTVNNLDISNENMTSSYSRIMDVDMAEEMTNYTTEQVISQAATSMLAQANERPSQVLQLLQ